MELTHFVTILNANTPHMPRVLWKDDAGEEMVFDGRLITTTSFCRMFQNLAQETEKMLIQEVLLSLELPDLQHNHIHDELNNTEPGYSFISDIQNHFHQHKHYLITAMLSSEKFGDRFFYLKHTTQVGGIAWNTAGLKSWLQLCEKWIGNLFALIHYGSGQPARGTELAIVAPQNTTLHRRNIYWYKGHVNIVNMYNKTQTNSRKPRLIGRSLPPPIGQLLITWLTLVVPTLDVIWTCWQGEVGDPHRFQNQLFTGISGNFDTNDFSSILASLSGKSVANFGMGYAMGIADTRHYLIGLLRKYCRGIAHRSMLEDYFNEQSGHDNDAAENYAITFGSILNVSEDHLEKFVEISKLQHKLLYPDVRSSLDIQESSSSIVERDQIDYQKLGHSIVSNITSDIIIKSASAMELAPLASKMATLLAPDIKQNIAEGLALISPGATQGNDYPQSSGFRQSVSSELTLDIQLVDVSQVKISPARIRELRIVMGHHAMFKSTYQACAVELAAQRKNDLLVVLGTGGGKSLLFMICAANTAESNLATVVIVPLQSLLSDLQSHLKKRGIKVLRWSSQTVSHYNANIILVLSDAAASDTFQSYFLRGCQLGKIARVILDEIHFLITSQHYRPIFNVIQQLREGKVPFVGMSATLPPCAISKIVQKMHFIPRNTLLIRAPTMRHNIIYSVFQLTKPMHSNLEDLKYINHQGQSHSIRQYINQFLDSFQFQERALVFCLTKRETEGVANWLQCNYYHSQSTNKEEVIESWEQGKEKVLVATNGLGTGYDYGAVKLVIHFAKPRNIIDFAQESGRAGRSIPVSYSTVFWDPQRQDEPLAPNQEVLGVLEMIQYVQTNACRRHCLAAYFDGVMDTKTCIDHGNVAVCDNCEALIESPVVSMKSES